MEALIDSQQVRSKGDDLGLPLASEVDVCWWAGGQSYRTGTVGQDAPGTQYQHWAKL